MIFFWLKENCQVCVLPGGKHGFQDRGQRVFSTGSCGISYPPASSGLLLPHRDRTQGSQSPDSLQAEGTQIPPISDASGVFEGGNEGSVSTDGVLGSAQVSGGSLSRGSGWGVRLRGYQRQGTVHVALLV